MVVGEGGGKSRFTPTRKELQNVLATQCFEIVLMRETKILTMLNSGGGGGGVRCLFPIGGMGMKSFFLSRDSTTHSHI